MGHAFSAKGIDEILSHGLSHAIILLVVWLRAPYLEQISFHQSQVSFLPIFIVF